MCSLIRNLLLPPPQPQELLADLRSELQKAHHVLQAAYNQFDQTLEIDLIDASSYEIKAAELRYNWLLRQAKGEWTVEAKEG